jgi:K+-transporting ATPase ATPase C chain
MRYQLAPAFRLTLIMTVLTGLLYPVFITGLCQLLFSQRANGSLVKRDGRVVGSILIGQSFTRTEYFHPRPSAAGQGGYDTTASGGSNYGPTSQKLFERVNAAVEKFRDENAAYAGPIPADLLTASGSGLDPDISPASAGAQADRVAKARGVSAQEIRRLVAAHIEKRGFDFLGEPRVNVLGLNLALDKEFPLNR